MTATDIEQLKHSLFEATEQLRIWQKRAAEKGRTSPTTKQRVKSLGAEVDSLITQINGAIEQTVQKRHSKKPASLFEE